MHVHDETPTQRLRAGTSRLRCFAPLQTRCEPFVQLGLGWLVTCILQRDGQDRHKCEECQRKNADAGADVAVQCDTIPAQFLIDTPATAVRGADLCSWSAICDQMDLWSPQLCRLDHQSRRLAVEVGAITWSPPHTSGRDAAKR